jgi:hypothetical protein
MASSITRDIVGFVLVLRGRAIIGVVVTSTVTTPFYPLIILSYIASICLAVKAPLNSSITTEKLIIVYFSFIYDPFVTN